MTHAAAEHQNDGLVCGQFQLLTGFFLRNGKITGQADRDSNGLNATDRYAVLDKFVAQLLVRNNHSVTLGFFPKRNTGVVGAYGDKRDRKFAFAPKDGKGLCRKQMGGNNCIVRAACKLAL